LLTLRAAAAGRLASAAGVLIGALGGATYWLAAQFWPSNVAVILAMAITDLLTTEIRSGTAAARFDLVSRLFFLLIKYNVLMALSAANLPFALPANLTLGLIMVCGYAASFALLVSVTTARQQESAARTSAVDLGLALLIGFAPAALLGVPGLIGLAAAIIASLGFVALLKVKRVAASNDILDARQRLAEISFYLGALASWRYV
jgi:adenosylcobinamide-GDP ribazoletransferase